MKRYSFLSLVRNALSYHENWPRAWRSPEPKQAYDVVIVGAGGHGLATAYYLAKEHGISNVAVVEKGYVGGGNTGRNTEVVRSNYLWDESAHLYEFSLKLWESLTQELNFNLMFSQRGLLGLGHSLQEMRDIARRVNANRLNGIDSELLTVDEIKELVPILNVSPNARYPILGGALQRRAGTARHDALAWGYARAADARGTDIIQHCEVTGIRRANGRVTGVETTKGFIAAPKVALATAGDSGVLAAMAGFRLPIESHPLQAWVTEPVKPVLDVVVMSAAVHAYISQTARGELLAGAGLDAYNGYGQRGSFSILEGAIAAIVELFPIFSRVRMMRQWGGIVDVCPDACPIVGKTPVDGLYINCGWGTGGYKSTPGSGWVYAYTIANDRPHRLNEPFGLDRFATGRLIDEHGAAGVAH
ncbi:MAG: sarcosine oxidase subunit beta family protein [Chloroflexi bacterium]|nr:sarcosine oxidase subunit beta family protein [Chloroflexota bacterium]